MRTIQYTYYFLGLSLLHWTTVPAQNIFRDLKPLEKRADNLYKQRAYKGALDLYIQASALAKNKNNSRLPFQQAKCYQYLHQTASAEAEYRKAIQMGWIFSNEDSLLFANVLVINGKYPEGMQWMQAGHKSLIYANSTRKKIKALEQASSYYRDSLCYTIYPLTINGPYSDFGPFYYQNGLGFVSNVPELYKSIEQINLHTTGGFCRLYALGENDSMEVSPIQLEAPGTLHIGSAMVYAQGKKLMFTASDPHRNNPNRSNVLQLYSAQWNDSKARWDRVELLPFNAAYYSCAHPWINEEGTVLYFASDMPGGKGATDIYVSYYENNTWSPPQNLGRPVNTEGHELYPFLTQSRKLYFVSDGHGGLGGMDIFYTDSLDRELAITNCGYPINSSYDDFSFILDAYERKGYFASARPKGKGEDDLYAFKTNRILLEVQIKEEAGLQQLKASDCVLRDKEFGNRLVLKPVPDKKLTFITELKPAHLYSLEVIKEDYKTFTQEISTYQNNGELISVKATLKRKYSYFANIKIRDKKTENLVDTAQVSIINLNNYYLDSKGNKHNGIVDVELETETPYLIVAHKPSGRGYMFIEKETRKKISAIKYYTITYDSIAPSQYSLWVKDSLGNPAPEGIPVWISHPLTQSEQKVLTSIEGKISFTLSDDLYFTVNTQLHGNELYYNSLNKISKGKGALILRKEH